jgi:hypothetical protein
MTKKPNNDGHPYRERVPFPKNHHLERKENFSSPLVALSPHQLAFRERSLSRHLPAFRERSSVAAWPIKTEHRCDYCGSQFGDMRPWDWPPDNPTRTIWLHERCEAPWYDSDGAPEGVR